MAKDDVTPIRQQYLDIKRQYPDAILFFRLGDFYETFDEDAEIAARELDIVLTSRPIGKGIRAPLAGIPYHAVENYLARLIQKGYHVAICEQVGEQPSKGLFPRKVVRVVTPGTIVEPACFPVTPTTIWLPSCQPAVQPPEKQAVLGLLSLTSPPENLPPANSIWRPCARN